MIQDYSKAKRKALRTFNEAAAAGRYPYLPALDDYLSDIEQSSRTYIGVMEIPVDRIVGTLTRARQNMFAADFLPLAGNDTEFAVKWANLYDYQVKEGMREAIKVFEYMGLFYVQEGNKRVSVSRYLENPSISADITRIMPQKGDDDDEMTWYSEFLSFFECTKLYDFKFTEIGSYRRLAKMLGKTLDGKWDAETISRLKADFARFKAAFKKYVVYRISVDDAFLMYLSVYGENGRVEAYGFTLEKQLNEMRKVFVTDGAVVAEKPVAKKQTLLLPDIKKILPQKKLHVAFVYETDKEDDPWVFDHEVARIYLKEKFADEADIQVVEGIANDKLFDVLKRCAASMDVIFTVSPLQMKETLRASILYPDVKFLNCSLNLTHGCVRTYYGRMYEVKFLLGTLAAMLSDDHKIGYLANAPVYGTFADINAFAMGASMADPSVQVYLRWAQTGDDYKKFFRENEIKLFSGVDFNLGKDSSAEYGLYSLGENNEIINLATPVWNWKRYYEETLRSVIDGTWETTMKDKVICDWWGLDTGMVDVVFSSRIPYASRKAMLMIKKALINHEFDIFSGEIHSKKGLVQGEGSGKMTNEAIITMGWLNDNIIGEIPTFWELSEKGKKMSEAAGVAKARES